MDNRHRDRDWPNLVGRRDVRLGPGGRRLGFARDIGRAISAAPDHPVPWGHFNGTNQGDLRSRIMRGLGVHWMDILYFVVVAAGTIAFGYFVLIASRRRR